MAEATKDETLVILKGVTLSFPHLDVAQPGQKPEDKAKFSGAFVVTPEVQKTPEYPAAIAAAKAAAVAKFANKAGAIPILGGKGAAIRTDMTGKGYPEGSVVINARNESQPGIVYSTPDPKNPSKPAKVPQDKIKELFYPGVKVNVQLRFYGYDKGVNKGVAASLQNIQLVGGGERLDNRQAAEDVAAFAESMNATPAGLEELVG
jgi:hypothetical protein